VTLTINGEAREISDGLTLAIVPREEYARTDLQTGDALEIVQMMAGG